jgi:predicted nuclease of predicted toxin-antitoxin system
VTDAPVFFVDRCLGRTVHRALRAAGYEAIWGDDEFEQNAKDLEWLPAIASEGWVLLTKDAAMRYNREEREAILESGMRCFVLASANLPARQQTDVLLSCMPTFLDMLTKESGAFIASVRRGEPRVQVLHRKAAAK